MPVHSLFSSAATLLYAVSALLSQNGAVHSPALVRQSDSFESSPSSQFMPYNDTAAQPFNLPLLGSHDNSNNNNPNHNNKLFMRRTTTAQERIGELKARARGLVTFLTHRPNLHHQGEMRKINGLSETDHRHHEQKMAESIFQTLLSHSFRHNESSPRPDEITYYDKETIATIFMDQDGNVTRCRLIEVIEPDEAERVLQMIAEKNKLIEKATFRTMLTIITACQGLEPKTVAQANVMYPESRPVGGPNDHHLHVQLMTENGTQNYNMWSLVSGILPGTKWCGLGDISSSYDDLGPERHLDKCCRAHDHCPIKIKAFRSRYGLVNWSLYTKSHCECDSLLYDCLKKASTPTAEMLGNFYFNVLRIQCVDDEDPMMCSARDPVTGQCKLWQPDDRQPKRMLFRSVQREF